MGKMSAKRRPGNDLNHDNWDEEQEQEEVGEFRKASADELKQRTFKVAKRRMRTAGGGEDDATDGAAPAAATSSVFSGFGGFGKLGDATKPASSTFSFLSAGNSAAAATTAAATASTVSPFASLSSLSSSDKSSNGTSTNNTTTTTSSTGGDARNAAYYAKLKGLNQSVSAWIAKHIAENPVCLLTPIFDDYAAHLKELEQSNKTTEPVKTPDYTFKAAATSKATETTPTAAPAVADTNSPFKSSFGASSFGGSAATPASTFSFGLSAAKPATTNSSSAETTTKAPASTFSFGSAAASSSTTSSSVAASKPTFSFGSAASTTSTAETTAKPPAATFSFGSSAASSSAAASGGASGFSFGGAASGSKPFTFANIKTPADHAREAAAAGTSGGDAGADEENEEPPKNEFTPVVEDDSLHSVRCKVFVKAGAEYVDRGVGQLFIKSAAEGTKTQLLVRADTNLGNVVLNILLTNGVPASRMGKNNVMIICVPTPDAKPEPVTVLVRVKNGEEADELLAQINKHKK